MHLLIKEEDMYLFMLGGAESGLYKTTDAGKTWNKINNGLPKVDMGRIGLAISPANPEFIYAIVEDSQDKGGFFKNTNRGASWEKQSDYTTSSNYYQEIVCAPKNVNLVYSMNTFLYSILS